MEQIEHPQKSQIMLNKKVSNVLYKDLNLKSLKSIWYLVNIEHLDCDCEEGPGVFANFLTLGSLLLVVAALSLSLFFVVKVVQVKHLFWHVLLVSPFSGI